MISDSVFPGPVYGGYGDAIARGSYTPAGFSTVLGLKDVMLLRMRVPAGLRPRSTAPIYRFRDSSQ